ncbi:MAG TPA: hypothetical protein VLG50_07785 [Candidatus Saccharimonadales bacterium]|nr:hypothetical protein [Candidatus Saccharimonadales bacterium]
MEQVIIEDKTYSLLPTTADQWVLLISSLIITILFLIAAYIGAQKPFYQELIKKFPQNAWLIAGLWLIASIISYGTFYLAPSVTTLWPWYVMINYLNLLWIVVFYIYESFYAALVIIFIIILIYFYLMLLVGSVNIWAPLLLLPLELLYIYLFYSLLHLASVNQIII